MRLLWLVGYGRVREGGRVIDEDAGRVDLHLKFVGDMLDGTMVLPCCLL